MCFYHNPITGKKELFFTHCVLCGKLIFRKKTLYKWNSLKSDKFYYCKNKKGHHTLKTPTKIKKLKEEVNP